MKRLLLLWCFVLAAGCACARSRAPKPCRIVFIGNSITCGALQADPERTAPPVVAAEYVARLLGAEVAFRNCGRSGATTVDFLPERDADFRRVAEAVAELQAEEGEALYVCSIMLGTNDSASTRTTGAPVSDEDYARNLRAIMQTVRRLCPGVIFVLQRPIWYSDNTYNNAMYLVEGQRRLAGYAGVLRALAAEAEDVFPGDERSYDFFREHYRKLYFPENGRAGVFYLHPNEKGARKLARNWARAIAGAAEAAANVPPRAERPER